MAGHRRLFRLLLGDARERSREVDEEIRSHLEMRAVDLEKGGLSPEAARAEAERRFGNIEGARRALTSAARVRVARGRRREWLASVASDVGLAFRRAGKAPGQTAMSLATFALVIGLTTTGFTVVDRVLIRSLPFPESERLVALQTRGEGGAAISHLSASIWLDWDREAALLERSALYSLLPQRWGYADDADAFNVEGRSVTPGFFDVLGVRMLAGRGFRDTDAGEPVAVVSEGFWRRVLGQAALPVEIDLAGSTREVVGVVPTGLEYPAGTDAYMAFTPRHRGGESYNWLNYFGIGRLADGTSAERAAAELAAIARGAGEENPDGQYLHGAGAIPLQEVVVGDVRTYVLLLMGAVLVLLLIACANLAGLGLARSSVRAPEMALRGSLGAGRLRLIRQLLTEHVMLALAGGLLGVGIAVLGTDLLANRAAEHLPRASEIGVDLRILAFTLVVSFLAGVLSGTAPALWASGASLRESLVGGRGAVRGGKGLPGAMMVGVEVALALVLLTGGSLLSRSFVSLLDRELGFDVENVITADATLGGRYGEDEWARFWPRIEDRLRPIPGVAAVGFTNAVPTGVASAGFIQVEGRDEGRAGAGYRVVSDEYFEAIGIALIEGRSFGPDDRSGTARVVVVNQRMSDVYWPDVSPIGRRVKAYSHEGGVPEAAEWLTVVGVVADVRQGGPESEARPEMFVSMKQVPQLWHLSQMTTVVRSRPGVPTGALIGPVREAFRAEDPRLAVEVASMAQRLSGLLSQQRLILALLGGFAILSLLLSAIGLYGLLAFAVARSRREMGIRTALGARRSGILRLVLGRAARVVAAGILAGLLLAFWSTRVLQSLLVDIAPRDATSFVAAVAMLVLVAAAAAFVPAWRATGVDPVETLRS